MARYEPGPIDREHEGRLFRFGYVQRFTGLTRTDVEERAAGWAAMLGRAGTEAKSIDIVEGWRHTDVIVWFAAPYDTGKRARGTRGGHVAARRGPLRLQIAAQA